jgi:uncharacterized protein YndB with AHSA1/START domain
MSATPTAKGQERIVLTRSYPAALEDVWALWTTPEGIESWWGPEGFAVTVRALDLRPGGELRYVMRAVDPQMIAFMKQQGMPAAQEAWLRYTEVRPMRRLAWSHAADFIPGVAPYEVGTQVDLAPDGANVKVVVTLDRMHDEIWTGRAVMGWEQELGKLGKALDGRAAAGGRP